MLILAGLLEMPRIPTLLDPSLQFMRWAQLILQPIITLENLLDASKLIQTLDQDPILFIMCFTRGRDFYLFARSQIFLGVSLTESGKPSASIPLSRV